MNIVIPGGSGYLGRVLGNHFSSAGHEVTIVSRRPTEGPWRYLEWDGTTLGPWAGAIEQADVIVNLAGRTVNCRYNEANKAEIYASRLESTRILGEAISRCDNPPNVWLNSSSATIYRHAEDRPMDEATGEIGIGFSVDVCQKWEQALADASTPATRKVAMRTAMVMGPGSGGPFEAFYKLVRLRLGGPMAGGKQFVSWIHADDFCLATEWLISCDLAGAVNVASPNPLMNADFMRTLREVSGVRIGLPAARWMLEIGTRLMGTETELVVKSRRVIPGRLLESGFTFRFPQWREAAADIVDRWN